MQSHPVLFSDSLLFQCIMICCLYFAGLVFAIFLAHSLGTKSLPSGTPSKVRKFPVCQPQNHIVCIDLLSKTMERTPLLNNLLSAFSAEDVVAAEHAATRAVSENLLSKSENIHPDDSPRNAAAGRKRPRLEREEIEGDLIRIYTADIPTYLRSGELYRSLSLETVKA